MDIDAPDSSEPAKSVVPVVSESEVKSAWLSAFDSALQVPPHPPDLGKKKGIQKMKMVRVSMHT